MNTLENPTKNQPDARLDASAALIFQALDPAQNVVVEACAGSGKTWLLASRIVRLLLAGVAPGEILAITFTRKAAREIEERVTRPMEKLLWEIPGVEYVYSTAMDGQALTIVRFVVGEPEDGKKRDKFQDLLRMGSKFDNFNIK